VLFDVSCGHTHACISTTHTQREIERERERILYHGMSSVQYVCLFMQKIGKHTFKGETHVVWVDFHRVFDSFMKFWSLEIEKQNYSECFVKSFHKYHD